MMISKTAIKLAAAVECREQPSTSIDIAACIIDLSEEVEEPDPVLGIGDIPVFSRGNISVIDDAAKSRKTFLVCHLAGMFLEENASGTIVILDTEMARFHAMRTVRRIHRIAGFDTNKNNSRLCGIVAAGTIDRRAYRRVKADICNLEVRPCVRGRYPRPCQILQQSGGKLPNDKPAYEIVRPIQLSYLLCIAQEQK
ncbi:hypothetical protein Barb6_02663 [Bacteroidales bacterium Barb6]|nr:hypothetical protein Barb6_02663 [Bacteroidales bacterium Barb6]